MFSQLYTSLTAQMNHLHVPAVYRGFVFSAIETGNFSVPSHLSAELENLLHELTGVAYTAFHNGLRAALWLSAGLTVLAALLALITLRSQPVDAGS
jgi:sugar phosphate permease